VIIRFERTNILLKITIAVQLKLKKKLTIIVLRKHVNKYIILMSLYTHRKKYSQSLFFIVFKTFVDIMLQFILCILLNE